jgi:hypothetical protein
MDSMVAAAVEETISLPQLRGAVSHLIHQSSKRRATN